MLLESFCLTIISLGDCGPSGTPSVPAFLYPNRNPDLDRNLRAVEGITIKGQVTGNGKRHAS